MMIFNTLKSLILLAALSGIIVTLGGLIGGQGGVQFALFFALLINGITFFFSDKIVLRMYGAQPLSREKYRWIYTVVEELAQSMHIPMPKLWIIDTHVANAFATGRSPRHASVAITNSIIAMLEHDELRAVLAHELAHIKNRDTLLTTIAATLATAIGYIAYYIRHRALWSAFSGNDRRKNGNPFVLMMVGLLMPIAATLLQLALSRSREYMADETGARHCHDPLALASALEKLYTHTSSRYEHDASEKERAMSALWIVNPFTTDSSWVTIFSTHPPVRNRITRLRRMFERMFS